MRVDERPVAEASGTILMHNIASADGRRVLKKGVILSQEEIALLSNLGRATVQVAVLEAEDVHEDVAAAALVDAMRTDLLCPTRPFGGRANLRTEVDGVLEVDAGRLLALNTIPGIALATRRQSMVVGPHQETDNVATLKIIPFAIRRRDLEAALELARSRPGIVEVRPFSSGRRVAMLVVGEPSVHDKLQASFEPPMRTRLRRLGAELVVVDRIEHHEAAIAQASAELARLSDLLIIVGQTSILSEEDITLRALRKAGARVTLSGAPVEPGNLLALAYLPEAPVMCAPGCAKALKRNVVDLVLPRLLLGDRLERADIAALGLGGFLTPAERAMGMG